MLATWEFEAAELSRGWVNLPMEIALGPDDMTLDLSLDWSGLHPLELDWCLRHPDPRYSLRSASATTGAADDRVLALRIWSYIPGCTVPVASDNWPTGRSGTWILPGEALAKGISLNTDDENTRYLEQFDMLQVHPIQGDFAAALLSGAIDPGIGQVSVNIGSLSDSAAAIDYAIAIAPTANRIAPVRSAKGILRRRGMPLKPALERLLSLPATRCSEWYRLNAQEKGRIDLLLAAPTTEPFDLYLITRMAEEAERPSFAWATFSAVTLRSDRG